MSSIEFDRDDEYFATAGVTKKIKIFDYSAILKDPIDMHYPVKEMNCRSKIRYITTTPIIGAMHHYHTLMPTATTNIAITQPTYTTLVA